MWDAAREKIDKNKLLDENFYHRFKSFKRLVGCGGAAYLLNSYEPALEKLLADVSTNGSSGNELAESVFAALFVHLVINVGLGFSHLALGIKSKFIEEGRKKLKKKVKNAIYVLWKKWVDQGLINEENRPWCLRMNDQQTEDFYDRLKKLKCRVISKLSKKYNEK